MATILFYFSMGVALYSMYRFVRYLGQRKQVGELLIPTLTGIKYSPVITQLVLFGISVIIIIIGRKGYLNNSENIITCACLMGGFLIYIIHSLLAATAQKGLYSEAIYCIDGFAKYPEIQKYDIVPQEKKDYSIMTFSCRGMLFANDYYIFVANEQIPEIKTALKKLRK